MMDFSTIGLGVIIAAATAVFIPWAWVTIKDDIQKMRQRPDGHVEIRFWAKENGWLLKTENIDTPEHPKQPIVYNGHFFYSFLLVRSQQGRTYEIGVGSTENVTDALYIQTELDRGIHGTVYAMRNIRPVGKLNQGTDLEWIKFNDATFVIAEPKEAAYKVFSPDLMAWYNSFGRKKPLVYIKYKTICVMREDVANLHSVRDLQSFIDEFIIRLQRSGALE